MRRRIPHRAPRIAHGGFTLAELLVTITIIGILASLMLAAVQATRSSARVAKTKATIAKLHSIIMPMYESYRTRRVPIRTAGMNPKDAARLRLVVLRDLMRMEMPDRWSDVLNPPLVAGVRRPSLQLAYARSYTSNTSTTYGSAECLYLIVTIGNPEARERFSESEIGDADGDGNPEFIDGWGNPIYFLRWAPAFNDSDLQPNIVPPGQLGQVSWNDPSLDPLKANAAESDHDPFDPYKIDRGAWRLVPLIVSAGPDGIYDISFSVLVDGSSGNQIPYEYRGDVYAHGIGLPADLDNTSVTATEPKNGQLDHYDNIHNHRIQAQR
ncbi:MAG TPA: type II secretion system protein [Planctomycetes bacterium]|nr:type II secretion system protein [Planctomycetota bacterium]